ncbi:DUF397 domain-containing protein [Saccharopolyspora sp. ASAGF58]|uniref:DUF397 domain-containing protein n=1 Tax=Saccharopolyspora sp. ASAGF58 TaxID=2719023 RepID=UPI0014402BD8|nr:DUF397 domain-containing protein [Saccharopolyspora sp. ASAGF58]QIZ35818.1 DUF397 domain-containing protein [Saccharopolyspora sp. ASAGF58]
MSVSHATPSGWRKSSRSTNTDNCVEVGHVGDGVAVRDTKNRAAGYFTTTSAQWAAFVAAVKADKFGA